MLVLYGVGALMATMAYISIFLSSRESALLLWAVVGAAVVGVHRLGYDEFALLRRGTILKMYEAPLLRRSMFVGLVDMAMVCASVYLAVALKA